MKLKNLYTYIFCLYVGLFFVDIQSTTVGSDKNTSRQEKTYFTSSDTDNAMIGFAVFEKGFIFENASTDCIFDALFPVSGSAVLNGGTLSLSRDMIFRYPFKIGPGIINGQNHALEFTGNVSTLSILSENHTKILSLSDQYDVNDKINAIDWSFDNKYIAVVTDRQSSSNELQIFYFNDEMLTLTTSLDFSNQSLYAVKWHPSQYYLAIGSSSGDELRTFSFNVGANTLEEQDSANIGTVTSLAWNSSGNYLAVGRYDSNDLLVYDVEGGALSSVRTATLYTGEDQKNSYTQKHSLDWGFSGNYLASCFKVKNTSNQTWYATKVFLVDDSYIEDSAYLQLSDYAYCLSCRPDSSLFVLGFLKSNERFRVYEYDADQGKIAEQTSYRLGEQKNVYDIDCSGDGNFVAYTNKKSNYSHELQLMSFDTTGVSLVSGYKIGKDQRSLSWSRDTQHIAVGGIDDILRVLKFVETPLQLENVKLFFSSDVILNGQIAFSGLCVLNGGGNIFEFSEDASIILSDGAELILEDMKIKNVSGTKIACAGNDSVITLRDVAWVQDGNYTFTLGSLQLKNDVSMSGDYIFAYQSTQTSTLLSKSTLELDLGFTFSYNPVGVDSKTLIQMEDGTSILALNGATLHTTDCGLKLTKGRIKVLRDSFLSSELTATVDVYGRDIIIDEGITFGNSSLGQDVTCDICRGVTLWITQGSLNYKNVLGTSFNVGNFTSGLYMDENTRLNLYENLDLGSGIITLANNTTIGKKSGKMLTGAKNPKGILRHVSLDTGIVSNFFE